MELRDIKRSLFGFKKDSVLEYISELNHICAEKIETLRNEKKLALDELNQKNSALNDKLISAELEIDKLKNESVEKDKKINELTADLFEKDKKVNELAIELLEKDKKINELTVENECLINDLNSRNKVEKEVADILTEARNFAKSLNDKTVRENNELKLANKKLIDAEKRRIMEYGREVNEVKRTIDMILKSTKDKLENVEKKITILEGNGDEEII